MTISSNEVFAKNMKYYMDKKGVNQTELAEIVGVSQPTVNEWLMGKKYPRINKIDRMADYFGILKSDLIEDKKNNPTSEGGGLSENRLKLMRLAEDAPEDKVELLLRVMRSILEG